MFNWLYLKPWWRWGESNSWPPACKAGALPAELHPHIYKGLYVSILNLWWAEVDSNHRPHAYQACALTCWAISPYYVFQTSADVWKVNSVKRLCSRNFFLTDHRNFGLKTTSRAELCHSLFVNLMTLFQLLRLYPVLLRKEVIQPHLPIRLPCYDFTLIINPTFDCCSLTVGSQASGVIDSHGVTGGVYKARERIHRGMLIRDY